MNRLTLKGLSLTIIGAIALSVSTGLMMSPFQITQIEPTSAIVFAEGFSLSLIPSRIGMPLFMSGPVILLISWLRDTKRQGLVVNRRN